MSRSQTQIRVRYSETDKMGVAHHSAMLNWFETGRVEWCRKAGIPYIEVEEAGYNMAVVEAHARYLRPVLFDSLVTIETEVTRFSGRMIHFHYKVFNHTGEAAAEGYTKHIVVNRQLQRESLPEGLVVQFHKALVTDAQVRNSRDSQ